MGKKIFKITLWTILGIVLFALLAVGGYVIYLSCQYYRIEDNKELEIINPKETNVDLDSQYKISTYNIGFGAYTHDFSFFMDSGEFKNGKKTKGVNSKAKNKETVLKNTNGAIETIKNENVDFAFFQEVDLKSTRSHKVNQYDMIKKEFKDYTTNFANNFHSGYLFYPIFDNHGIVNSGIATFSKYKIDSSVRRSFPVDNGFVNKFFDLDRCFNVNRLKINGSQKELVLINLHMSAYDKGGIIRAKQLEMLNKVLKEENDKGNYVIAGGDFNHDIANTIENVFPTEQKIPEWVFQLKDEDLAEGFKFAAASNSPTCRSTDIKYEKGINYSVVLDGFIVSNNVTVVSNKNIDTDFKYSDHNPATMTFKLS